MEGKTPLFFPDFRCFSPALGDWLRGLVGAQQANEHLVVAYQLIAAEKEGAGAPLEALEFREKCLTASRACGDPAKESKAQYQLGQAHEQLADIEHLKKALGHYEQFLALGEKGSRTALPYGTVMLHQPRGQQAQGQASDIAIKAREVLTNRRMALEIMSEATGVPLDKLTADTNRCKYLDAHQAIEYGIVDKVVTKADKTASAAQLSELSRGLG